MKKIILAVVLVAIAVLGWWIYRIQSTPPTVPFAKAVRQKIANNLSTNGKVEPQDYAEVHASVQGLISRLPVHLGQTVAQGQVFAEISQPGLQDELQSAEARAAEARAELSTLTAGGRSADVAEIEGNLSVLRRQRESAQATVDSLQRLVQKQAATTYELKQAQDGVAEIDAKIAALEQRRGALVSKGDIEAAQARIRDADAAVALAKTHLAQNVITAPLSGVIYDLPVRAGAYVHPGDLLGDIGKIDPVRVRVYVDEPELGRVAIGQPVRITWDALPSKEWTGTVDKLPTQIVALGARQVGEVLCTIHNEAHELLPGTNVNAFILTEVIDNALTIPKAAVRQEQGTGVYVLQKDGSVKWTNITTGASDALNVQVTGGLSEGDEVMLPSDITVHDGDHVIPKTE
ncbi:MAG TPA: efflux RND transporter periplasmic adaptor subunit [Bryobacteraceae bacterium]|nr:efflux RND transporter periplasmic adaptor subunit [Bryobacteraceae bacterium]